MNGAADFKQIALNALRGKWPIAVLTGFVASLMGAGIATSGSSSGSGSSERTSIGDLMESFPEAELWLRRLSGLLIAVLVIVILWALVTMVIGGAGKLGYATFNLNLVDHRDAAFPDLFSQFYRLWDGFCMNFLVGLYTLLWSLLLVIPGLIKQFSYAMTPYILAENPGMTATEAITESRRIMDGNKFRLFCLGFSFIGWSLLCALPVFVTVIAVFGVLMSGGSTAVLLWLIPGCLPTLIGSLFLTPYREAAQAAFYRDVAGIPTPAEHSTDASQTNR